MEKFIAVVGISFVLLIFVYSCRSILIGLKKFFNRDSSTEEVEHGEGGIKVGSFVEDIFYGLISLVPVVIISYAIYITILESPKEGVYYYGGYINKEDIVDVDYYSMFRNNIYATDVAGIRMIIDIGDGKVKTLSCPKNLCDLTLDYSNGVHLYYKSQLSLNKGYAVFSVNKLDSIDGYNVINKDPSGDSIGN